MPLVMLLDYITCIYSSDNACICRFIACVYYTCLRHHAIGQIAGTLIVSEKPNSPTPSPEIHEPPCVISNPYTPGFQTRLLNTVAVVWATPHVFPRYCRLGCGTEHWVKMYRLREQPVLSAWATHHYGEPETSIWEWWSFRRCCIQGFLASRREFWVQVPWIETLYTLIIQAFCTRIGYIPTVNSRNCIGIAGRVPHP